MGLFAKKATAVAVGSVPPSAEDGVDAPWLRAGHQHDDTFLRLCAQVANWRMFAFFAIGVAAFSVFGTIYIGAQSKFVPMLVEVDKLGRTLAVRAVSGDDAVTDSRRLVYREMFDLIENLRSVTTDRLANNDRLSKGFSRLDGAAKAYARTELRKAPANDVGSMKTVQVKVKTALKLVGKSWQIEWEEHSFSLVGEEIGVEQWKATLQYELAPGGDELSIRKNPIGFTVSELSWQKVI